MKTLELWNPFRELDEVQNRLSGFFGKFPKRLTTNGDITLPDWSPEVDITEDDKEYLVKADLPEMKKEEVKVTVEDGILSISGERKSEKEKKNKKFHRIERFYGTFVRTSSSRSPTMSSVADAIAANSISASSCANLSTKKPSPLASPLTTERSPRRRIGTDRRNARMCVPDTSIVMRRFFTIPAAPAVAAASEGGSMCRISF